MVGERSISRVVPRAILRHGLAWSRSYGAAGRDGAEDTVRAPPNVPQHHGPGKLVGKTALITGMAVVFSQAVRHPSPLSALPQSGTGIVELRSRNTEKERAGSGIGRHAALLFAQEGASVVAADRNLAAAARTVDAMHELNGQGVAVGGDVSVADDVAAMVAKAEKVFGGLHIVFNNAGIMDSGDDNVINTPDDVIDRTLAINVKGVIYGCRYGIPAIIRSGGGSVINTASFVAFLGAATPQIAYTASKGAVLALTRELAVIHAREGVRVNSLCPGPLRTELLMKFLDTEEKKQRRLVHIPMGRFGEAIEMAKAALFLASSDSSYMTGASLLVDGGITSAYVTPQ